jgi:rhodanese-related sulfurtransferase
MLQKSVLFEHAVVFLVVLVSNCAAGPTDVRKLLPKDEDWTWSVDTQGPMCGVYSVSRALTILGYDVAPAEFWSLEYVGNSKGSTPEELVAAVRSKGAYATVVQNMSITDLLTVAAPVIANVRQLTHRNKYDHWVCVVATDDGLRVFDGPGRSRLVDPTLFASSWSGIGIVVAKSPLTGWGLRFVRAVCMIALVTGTFLVLSVCSTNTPATLRSGFGQVAAATVVSFVIGTIIYGVVPWDFEAVRAASLPYTLKVPEETDLKVALDASRDPNQLLVDARLSEDFRRGSLPGAVNIPVTAQQPDVGAYLTDVPLDTPIVVFCQSRTCDYDERVAGIIASLKFSDVRITSDGYYEYSEEMRESKKTPKSSNE